MTTINLLKTLINIYYYLLILAIVAGLVTAPILLLTNRTYEISLFGQQFDFGSISMTKSIIITVVFGVVLYFYFRTVQLMRITVLKLQKGHFFSEVVIVNFRKLGKLFLICGFGFMVMNIVLKLFLESKLWIGIDSSLFIFIITGLFFLLLSKIFEEARVMKQENDLTI